MSDNQITENKVTENKETPLTSFNDDVLMNIPVTLSLEVGDVELSMKKVSEMGIDSVIKLNKKLSDHLDIYVNGSLIARAELVVIDDNYGAKIVEVIGQVTE